MRPWTLRRADATVHVPFITDLNLICRSEDGEATRGWRGAWKQYVRGRVVSEHSKCIIINFLSADSARGTRDDADDDELQAAQRNTAEQEKEMQRRHVCSQQY